MGQYQTNLLKQLSFEAITISKYINYHFKSLMFLKDVPYAHQGCIILIKDTVKYYYNLK